MESLKGAAYGVKLGNLQDYLGNLAMKQQSL